ncbi:hypothetical protein BGX30_002879 [Mortierella sp. GBA39]|nr:hypothetical protein BGX30_002879 [Mortierella sp. GBA39]
MKTLWVWMLVIFIGVLIHPAASSAHAYLTKSSPSDNEVMTQAPAKVTLQFNEALQPAFHSIIVMDSSGAEVNQGNSRVPAGQPAVLEVDLKTGLPDGIYTVQWKAVSGDGHPVNGTFPRKLLGISYAALILGVLLSLPMQTAIEAGVGWSEVWNAELLGKMLRITSFGHIWLVQVILVLLLGALLYAATQSTEQKGLRALYAGTLLTGVGLLLSKAFIGHAASAESIWMPVFMDFLHLVSVSIWLGCLLALGLILPREASLPNEPDLRKKSYFAVIERFSLWGTTLVAAVLISGVYASLTYVPTWYSLLHTAYGRILLLKCVLLLVMLGFAAVHLIRGQRRSKPLGAGVWIEFAAGIAALVLAAALSNLPPASSNPGPVNVQQTLDNRTVVTLQISPNIAGENTFEVGVKDASGKPVQGIQQIKLTLTSLDMEMGKYEIEIPGAGKTYKAQDLISMAGRWNVHVHILTESLDAWDTDFQITVGSS